MLGNVREWVEDCSYPTYEGAPVDGTARLRDDCKIRVMRGGGWSTGPDGVGVAKRFHHNMYNRDDSLGFRVATSVVSPRAPSRAESK